MTKYYLISILLISLLAGCGLLGGGTQEKPVNLKDLGPDFSKYEAVKEVNNFQEKKLTYLQVGMAKYDAFFKEAAVFRSRVEVSKSLIDYAEKNLETEPNTSLEALQLVVKTLPDMVDSGKKLLSQGQGLLGSVVSDFAGPNALKLPDVKDGVSQSIDYIKNSVDEIPNLIKSGKKLLKTAKKAAKNKIS